ncbi:hypothetical protein Q4I30_005016 [Leishmania utingensis]|uniref:Protein kinase domain-containing protein n=1 Tax=Leishmania utingensis TaxID=653362 RepID=A0AAW3AD94_9TRYP
MMAGSPKLVLGSLHNISERSIFFIPLENDRLDLKTVSTAPPSHRSVLQRNGLVAKVCVGVTLYEAWAPTISPPSYTSPGGETCASDAADSVGQRTLSAARREELCCSALVYAGLLHDRWDGLVIPEEFAATPWPVHTEKQYTELMEELMIRKACATVNTSGFCVPVLSIDEFVYKHKGVRVCLGVTWMPRYPQNLWQWAAQFAQSGHRVPEASLLALLHHVTAGALSLSTAISTASRLNATPSLSVALEKVLVYPAAEVVKRTANKADSDEVGGGFTFVLSTGAFKWRQAEPCADKNSERNATAHFCKECRINHVIVPDAELLLYRPPEDCSPELYPTNGNAAAKRVAWELGVVIYLLASGVAGTGNATAVTSPCHRSSRCVRLRELAPLNSADHTPDSLWKRLRQELERRGYSSTIVTVVAQLLSLDPLTRPSLNTVDHMLQELQRPTPVRRFPFALGSYNLLRMPNPTDISLNPGARRYTMEGRCVLCKRQRGSTASCAKGSDHIPGLSSPSWSDEELLPQLPGMHSHYITFLYPLCGSSDARRRRKLVALALQIPHGSTKASSSIVRDTAPLLDSTLLFQVFGGFAVYERVLDLNTKGQAFYRVTVREVLVPYPSEGLRRSELTLVKLTIDFCGGLPWPSSCTEILQKSGRVSRSAPLGFTGTQHDVEWFGWVLPGERFSLPNGGHWTAPRDGAFVFWFSSDLRPTDRDRYFALTSLRAATLAATLSRTVMPDSLFRLHAGDKGRVGNLLGGRVVSVPRPSACLRRFSVLRGSILHRRSCDSVADIVLPSATREIVEEGEKIDTLPAHGLLSLYALPVQNTPEEPPSNGRRQPSSIKNRVPSRCTAAFPVGVIDAVEATAEVQRRSDATPTLSLFRLARCTSYRDTPATHPLHHPGRCFETPRPDACASADRTKSLSPDLAETCNQTRLTERNATQLPVYHDASANRARAVAAPEQSTPHAVSRSLISGRKKTCELHAMTVSFEELRDAAVVQSQAGAPLSVVAERPVLSAMALAQSMPFTQSISRRGSPRPLKLRTVAYCGTGEVSIQETSSATTPKLPPISGAQSAGLRDMHVNGVWLPSETVDATFRALTFCVLATGEHGYMHPPVKISTGVAHAIRALPGAAFLSFLSNQVPLLHHNHPQLDAVALSLMLPHHGFTCYAADGTLLGVLALRCSTKTDPDATAGEFELVTHASATCRGKSDALRTIYASYVAGNVGAEAHRRRVSVSASKARNDDGTADGEASPLRHMSYVPHRASGNRNRWANTPENQTLSFTSARPLVGDFTPSENGDISLSLTQGTDMALPACWMDFDEASTALLFADAEQSMWVPYRIGE